MLPGFRFLFAATLLTVSLLVFGLGAAALLRASHEQFVSLPKQAIPAPIFAQTADAALPTLSMLRVERESVESRPEPIMAPTPADTLLPNDRIAALSAAPRAENPPPPPPPVIAEPEVKAEIKPEQPKIEAKVEGKLEAKLEGQVEAKIEQKSEPLLEASIQIAPLSAKADVAIATPAEALAVSKADEPSKVETPAVITSAPAPQQVAALSEPDITGSTPAPQAMIEAPLVNAKPIRKPPTPRDRPTDADVVAALPDAAISAPATDAAKPSVRKRKPVVKRVAKPKRRVVSRPAQLQPTAVQNPASPFGTPGFRT